MGIVSETVTDVSQRLLAEHGGLFQRENAELARVRGLGDAKSVRLTAAIELGRRHAILASDARPTVTSPNDVANLLQIKMAALAQAQLRVVLFDTNHCILAMRTVCQESDIQVQSAALVRSHVSRRVFAKLSRTASAAHCAD